jgi:SAM-dependent methyltransferase
MTLSPEQRTKLDASNDRNFYDYPRLVTHVDQGFITQLTDLYRDRLKPGMRILDLMSSWVSHLPEEIAFEHVEGHGMNEEELAKNPRLNHYFIQNLNQDLKLPLEDQSFDAVLCTVSVQYMQYPEAIFTEIYRILKTDGLCIMSFSNRMFYQKAIAAWRDGSERDRIELVKSYYGAVPRFSTPEVVQKIKPAVPAIFQAFGMGGGDPFYAVIARRML